MSTSPEGHEPKPRIIIEDDEREVPSAHPEDESFDFRASLERLADDIGIGADVPDEDEFIVVRSSEPGSTEERSGELEPPLEVPPPQESAPSTPTRKTLNTFEQVWGTEWNEDPVAKTIPEKEQQYFATLIRAFNNARATYLLGEKGVERTEALRAYQDARDSLLHALVRDLEVKHPRGRETDPTFDAALSTLYTEFITKEEERAEAHGVARTGTALSSTLAHNPLLLEAFAPELIKEGGPDAALYESLVGAGEGGKGMTLLAGGVFPKVEVPNFRQARLAYYAARLEAAENPTPVAKERLKEAEHYLPLRDEAIETFVSLPAEEDASWRPEANERVKKVDVSVERRLAERLLPKEKRKRVAPLAARLGHVALQNVKAAGYGVAASIGLFLAGIAADHSTKPVAPHQGAPYSDTERRDRVEAPPPPNEQAPDASTEARPIPERVIERTYGSREAHAVQVSGNAVETLKNVLASARPAQREALLARFGIPVGESPYQLQAEELAYELGFRSELATQIRQDSINGESITPEERQLARLSLDPLVYNDSYFVIDADGRFSVVRGREEQVLFEGGENGEVQRYRP